MGQFVEIEHRSGVVVSVNAQMVCSVRSEADLTVLGLANGQFHRTSMPAEEVIAMLEAALKPGAGKPATPEEAASG